MSRLIYKWDIKPKISDDIVQSVSSKYQISKTLAKILINRGFDTEDKILKFISSDIIYLNNPFLFEDMVSAITVIKKHIDNKSPILIWGDRDTDGVTSVVLLYKTLKSLGAEVDWYIPQTEGYGLNIETIDKYKNKVKLIITVDCGISAIEELKHIKNLGMEIVLTDHHEPPEEIYSLKKELNIPVINPYMKEYSGFRDLAGVGVVLKLVWGLMMSFDENIYNKEYVVLDLETTGLSPTKDEICEIAAVKIKNFIPYETFQTLVKPKNLIPESATNVHGITNEMVSDAPSIKDVLPKFLDFVKDTPIVVHNAEFDMMFINNVLKINNYDKLNNEVIDTLLISRQYFPLKSHSLKSMSNEFLFKNRPTHRALNDVAATIELFNYLYYFKNTKIRFFIENNLDIVSLGTISDIMPLIEDNRIIVKKGLEMFSNSRKPVFKTLLNYLTKKTSFLDSESISWYIVPILNAAGRMQKAEVAVHFLLSENVSDAEQYFNQLININSARRNLQETNKTKFYDLIEEQCDIENDLILVVVAENLEHGERGVVANYVMKEFGRPVVLLILENGTATGAVRSPKSINIYDILKKLDYLYIKFGGHEHACGLTIHKDKIETFRQEIKKLQKEVIMENPVLSIDTELSVYDIGINLVRELDLLEPCGPENPYPVFLLKNVKVVNWKYIGSGKKYSRLTLELSGMDTKMDSVCWDIPEIGDIIKNFSFFDIVGQIELDEMSKLGYKFVILDLQPVI
ncbi:MAG: single-stranded-DNA-specific exonuclease RecJ [Endomicrobiia bacterium]